MPIKSIWIPSSLGRVKVYSRNSGEIITSQSLFTPCHCDGTESRLTVCSDANNWCYPPPYRSCDKASVRSTGPCEAKSSFQFSGMDWKLRQQKEVEEASYRQWQRACAKKITFFGETAGLTVISSYSHLVIQS